VLLVGTALATLLIWLVDRLIIRLPNPGLIYLPLVGMLAYYWGWRYAVIAGVIQVFCVYYFFIPPYDRLKRLDGQDLAQLIVLTAVTGFVLAIVQLARSRRILAEREAGRFAALNRVGTALSGELDESRLLHAIAQTAVGLTGGEFAAFTLRPLDELGRPLVPSEGSLFHLAAVVGVTKEQEALFRRMPLGGEGLLAPIFSHGMPVRVADALAAIHRPEVEAEQKPERPGESRHEAARRAALTYAHGTLPAETLHYVGIPRGHPVVRSFLGAPLLDRSGQVRGGLLLGHSQPDRFSAEDEALLVGLATQAALALENARLFSAAQTQAEELDAIFESIGDGIMLVDAQGTVLRENAAARRLREAIERDSTRAGSADMTQRLRDIAARAGDVALAPATTINITGAAGESREYVVSTSPLGLAANWQNRPAGALQEQGERQAASGAVVVWHDVTEARRLLEERQARADAEARRALLQAVIDELPSGVYLVQGDDARLILSNRAAMEVWGASWSPGQPMVDFLRAQGTRIFAADGRLLTHEELATLRAVHSGEAVRHYQEIIHHPDGAPLPVLLNAVALDAQVLGVSLTSGASGEPQTPERVALVVLQDVSALKEAERLKDEFITIAAHELRTPMAAVKGFADMLMLQTARGHGPELADWQQEALTAIDEATARLVELTEDLLDVTRLQAGRLELTPEPTDLAALARRVAARLQVTSARHSIQVRATPEHVVCQIDARRIEQVLVNMLSNAIKYSPEGGEVEVDMVAHTDTELAEVCVRDRGIGIPADQHARIFGRFARAANAQELGIGGTGLGLYLSRELVERQGGRIWFDSAEGQGTVFHVTLPLIGEDAASTPERSQQSSRVPT
jgi:signal transduction histidine kinase